jgi:hypothetical protein
MFLDLLKELNCECETLKKMVLPDAAANWRGGHVFCSKSLEVSPSVNMLKFLVDTLKSLR